jgi:hypothetical protein
VKFGIDDIRLGTRGEDGAASVNVPFNFSSVLHVHIHPAGSRDGFSGWAQAMNGKRRFSEGGDIGTYLIREVNGTVFRAGDRASWHFDTQGFLKAVAEAPPRPNVSFKSFVKKTR